MRAIAAGMLLVLLGACASESVAEEGVDVVQVVPDAGNPDATGEDIRIRYTDEAKPRVDLPDDTAGLAPPLQVVGQDTGQAGLVYAAALAGYYLLSVQKEDGSFRDLYHPAKDEWREEEIIHRELGPAYGLVLLYGATKRPEFLIGADWVFEYAAEGIVDKGDAGLRLSDIGATCIAIFGLSHWDAWSGDGKWRATLLGLATHLLSLQNEDGSFAEGSPLARGQAVQALGHLDKLLGGEAYRDALTRAATYACDTWRDIDPGQLLYFMYYSNEALRHLHAVTSDARWATCVAEMTQSIIDDQYLPEDEVDAAWIGGFGRQSGAKPTWSASLRLEGISDALGLAQDRGETARVADLTRHMRVGAEFVIRQQWRKGETDDFPNPGVAIGDFPFYIPSATNGDLGWPQSRTDLAWHGLAMLLKTATVLGDEVFPAAPE